QGFNVTYQWHRHGTNLINAGNISGVTSSQLVISPAGPADVLSGANGYYVTVTGAGPFSTNSTTSALSLVTATNLIYSGSGPWDLNTSGSWQDAIGDMGLEFNFGDAVTFDDTGGGGTVTLTGTYLSASSVTVNHTSSFYTFTGSGSFAGPGNLIYTGSGQFNVNNANTFSGGTLINNAGAKLHLGNLNGLGTGPITNATAGAQMEITVAASSTTGIPSDLVILDDFTNIFDPVNSSFGGVYNGNISGTSGKTLIINHSDTDLSNGSDTNITRLRFAGTNTVCNANIFLNDSTFLMASYQTTGTQTYNGVISGSGAFMMKGTITYLNGPNTFTGGATPATGAIGLGIDTAGSPGSLTSGPIGTGPLLLAVDSTTTTSGSGEIFASGGSRIFGNAIQYPSATNNLTLIIGGTNDLTITGAYSLNGNDGLGVGTNRTIQVTNTAATTISTVITDAGLGIGLIKTGPGTLDLNAANTYGGTTTINAGVLAGSGSLNGPVMVNTNGAAIGGGPATSMGTFTVNNSLTFSNGGGGFFRINRAGLASDTVSVSGALTNIGNGIITLNNLGAALQLGDKFTLFNKPVSNGAAMFVLGGNVGWANNLAVDGSVAVAASPDTGIQLAGPASIPPGNITNIITVTNIGPGTALDLVITDAVPANTIFVRADSGGTTNGHAGVVVWNLSNLAINTSTNFTLVFNAAAVETVTNTANVVSAAADPAPANNFATNFIVVASAIIPTVPPHVSSFSLVAGNVIINGTNGVTGGTYYLLGTTNLIKPLVQWTPVATNVVITNGASNNGFTFTGTNVITAGAGQQFYILSSTNNH
ncbi:MAG TPA: autotransporter-associated beta strand repeat-containing protein, partial [Candidatus Acidoferrales bacterium]|nr:autotransporter-associated beta strand repeat-containing protein [Candidatus Acidoferrales bacterium]